MVALMFSAFEDGAAAGPVPELVVTKVVEQAALAKKYPPNLPQTTQSIAFPNRAPLPSLLARVGGAALPVFPLTAGRGDPGSASTWC